jgi:hypothetical protein
MTLRDLGPQAPFSRNICYLEIWAWMDTVATVCFPEISLESMKNRVSGIILILLWNLEFAICISFFGPMHIFISYIIANLAFGGYTFFAKFSIFKWKKLELGWKYSLGQVTENTAFLGLVRQTDIKK